MLMMMKMIRKLLPSPQQRRVARKVKSECDTLRRWSERSAEERYGV